MRKNGRKDLDKEDTVKNAEYLASHLIQGGYASADECIQLVLPLSEDQNVSHSSKQRPNLAKIRKLIKYFNSLVGTNLKTSLLVRSHEYFREKLDAQLIKYNMQDAFEFMLKDNIVEFSSSKKAKVRLPITEQSTRLPEAPPRLWPIRPRGRPKRGGGSSALLAFIREVYGPYFAKFRLQLRAYIFDKDFALYQAIADFERGGRQLPRDIRMPSERDIAERRFAKALRKEPNKTREPERKIVRRRRASLSALKR